MNVARHPLERREPFGRRRLVLFLAIVIGFVVFKFAGTAPDEFSRSQIVFAVLTIGLIFNAIGVYVRQGSAVIGGQGPELAVVDDPSVSRVLFSHVGSAPIWLVIRLYVGYEWLSAGLNKVTVQLAGWFGVARILNANRPSSRRRQRPDLLRLVSPFHSIHARASLVHLVRTGELME